MQESEEEDYDLYQEFEASTIANTQQYQVFQTEEIFKWLEEEIKSLQEIVPFNFDNSLELFIHYNWNRNKINDNYFSGDQDKIIENLKISGEFNDHNISIKANQNCPKCLLDQELVQLGCGHTFCKNCLEKNVRQEVEQEGHYHVRCLLDGCQYRLPYSFIITCTQEYNRLLCQQYIESNKSLTYCTGQDCFQIIKSFDTVYQDIRCECGNHFCFSCKEDVHSPASCDLVQKWLKAIRNGEENQKWIDLNIDKCPFCHNQVSKIENNIQILCDQPGGCFEFFCYICSNPWDYSHTENTCPYFIEKPLGEDYKQMKKSQERFLFYYNGFIQSENSKKLAQEKHTKLQDYRQILYDRFGFTFQDSQLLKDAMDELIQSMIMLKWLYCLGYYSMAVSQFMDNDQCLLEFKDSSEYLAFNLTDLFEEIEILKLIKQKLIDNSKLKLKMKQVQVALVTCSLQRRSMEKSVYNGDYFN